MLLWVCGYLLSLNKQMSGYIVLLTYNKFLVSISSPISCSLLSSIDFYNNNLCGFVNCSALTILQALHVHV